MTNKDARDLINKEYTCLCRQSDNLCTFNCENCDLVRTVPEVLEAQRIALRLLDIEEDRIHKIRNAHNEVVSKAEVITND